MIAWDSLFLNFWYFFVGFFVSGWLSSLFYFGLNPIKSESHLASGCPRQIVKSNKKIYCWSWRAFGRLVKVAPESAPESTQGKKKRKEIPCLSRAEFSGGAELPPPSLLPPSYLPPSSSSSSFSFFSFFSFWPPLPLPFSWVAPSPSSLTFDSIQSRRFNPHIQ